MPPMDMRRSMVSGVGVGLRPQAVSLAVSLLRQSPESLLRDVRFGRGSMRAPRPLIACWRTEIASPTNDRRAE